MAIPMFHIIYPFSLLPIFSSLSNPSMISYNIFSISILFSYHCPSSHFFSLSFSQHPNRETKRVHVKFTQKDGVLLWLPLWVQWFQTWKTRGNMKTEKSWNFHIHHEYDIPSLLFHSSSPHSIHLLGSLKHMCYLLFWSKTHPRYWNASLGLKGYLLDSHVEQ